MPWFISDEYRSEHWPLEPRLSEIRQQAATNADAYMRNLVPRRNPIMLDCGLVGEDPPTGTVSEQIIEEALVNWCLSNTQSTLDIDIGIRYNGHHWLERVRGISDEIQGNVYYLHIFDDCNSNTDFIDSVQLFFQYEEDAIFVKMSL